MKRGSKGSPSGLLLVSVGATAMTPGYVENVLRVASGTTHVVILDSIGAINEEIFEGAHPFDALAIALQRGSNLYDKLVPLVRPPNELVKFSDFESSEGFRRHRTFIRQCYEMNRSFKNHCLSQTYRNLQPKLKKLKINSKRDKRVEFLSNYLLDELALILLFVCEFDVEVDYGPEMEMEILRDLFDARYCIPEDLPSHRLQRVVVPMLGDAHA